MPWQIVHRCSLCVLFSLSHLFVFFCLKFFSDQMEPRNRKQEDAMMFQQCRPKTGRLWDDSVSLCSGVSEDSRERAEETLHQRGSNRAIGLCVMQLLRLSLHSQFAVSPQTPPDEVQRKSAEEGGGGRSLREQIQVKRLSQWRCVHSFMSFESPEEISAKSTEPHVQERRSIPVCW